MPGGGSHSYNKHLPPGGLPISPLNYAWHLGDTELTQFPGFLGLRQRLRGRALDPQPQGLLRGGLFDFTFIEDAQGCGRRQVGSGQVSTEPWNCVGQGNNVSFQRPEGQDGTVGSTLSWRTSFCLSEGCRGPGASCLADIWRVC